MCRSPLSAPCMKGLGLDEVQDTLQMLFEKQYILTETVVKPATAQKGGGRNADAGGVHLYDLHRPA